MKKALAVLIASLFVSGSAWAQKSAVEEGIGGISATTIAVSVAVLAVAVAASSSSDDNQTTTTTTTTTD